MVDFNDRRPVGGVSNPLEPHQMTRDEFEAQPGTLFHGSPNGVVGMKVAKYGLHVGTKRAALEALSARVGSAGDRPTGATTARTTDAELQDTLENTRRNPKMSGKASYSDGSKVYAPDPKVIGGRVSGKMTNTPRTPHEDFKANGMMAGQLKRGRAKSGYYYQNVGEDAGSISAVLPSRDHFRTHEDHLVEARAQGKSIPKRAMKGYKEIPGQGRLF